jgi:hypothetical protein
MEGAAMPGCGLLEDDEKLVDIGLNPPLRSGASRRELFLDDFVESDLDRCEEDCSSSSRFEAFRNAESSETRLERLAALCDIVSWCSVLQNQHTIFSMTLALRRPNFAQATEAELTTFRLSLRDVR